MRPPGWSLFCFNSLQTGKSFRTYVFQHHPYNISEQFQFPSNGKVLSDEQNPLARFTAAIMFQFPSNGKVLSDLTQTIPYRFRSCFNSLQTGKSFRTGIKMLCKKEFPSFNSLQTGKSFRTKLKMLKGIIFF